MLVEHKYQMKFDYLEKLYLLIYLYVVYEI
jgi:hypothetical protein